MLTVSLILALSAFITSVMAARGVSPTWLPALLLSLALLLQMIPVR